MFTRELVGCTEAKDLLIGTWPLRWSDAVSEKVLREKNANGSKPSCCGIFVVHTITTANTYR